MPTVNSNTTVRNALERRSGFDAQGLETTDGSASVTLFPGSPPEPIGNPDALKEALRALTGQIPIPPEAAPTAPVLGASPAVPGTAPPDAQAAATVAAPQPGASRHAAAPQLAPGWGPAAIAINSFRRIENPLVLFLQPQGHGTIVIDLMAHEFNWTTPLSAFPADPGVVAVGTQPVTLNSPSPLQRPGQDLDALLWLIGLAAFPRGRAPWLAPDEKVRLRRWPYFEALEHTAEQEKLIKVLARGFMTVDKLAAAAKADRAEAQRVVNALSLMLALRRSGGESGPAAGGTALGGDLSSLPPPGSY